MHAAQSSQRWQLQCRGTPPSSTAKARYLGVDPEPLAEYLGQLLADIYGSRHGSPVDKMPPTPRRVFSTLETKTTLYSGRYIYICIYYEEGIVEHENKQTLSRCEKPTNATVSATRGEGP